MREETIQIDHSLCLVCGCCVGICPVNAMALTETRLEIDNQVCNRCERCIHVCPAGALSVPLKAVKK